MRRKKNALLINTVIAAGMAAIFAIDLNTPLGVAVPLFYLLLALFAIGIGAANRSLLAIAILGPLLAVLKILLSPDHGIRWFGEANRLIFSLLLWAAIGVEWVRRHLDAKHREAGLELERLVHERTEALHAANQKLAFEVGERQQAEAKIVDYTQRLQALTSQLVDAQEAERKALATELHDRIGQNLSALNLSLNLNLAQLAGQLPAAAMAPVGARIKDALALVEQTTEIVRGVMEELHPALLDQYGLDTALRWYGEEFAQRTGIEIRCSAGECFPRLHGKVEMALFRIAQEALTNVAKHARAKSAGIFLQRTGDGIEMRISDDGIGIAANGTARPAGSGWGLSIMAERARSLGAEIQIGRNADHGTSLVVSVPNGLWENE